MSGRPGRRMNCLACAGDSLSATELNGQPFSICETCGCVFANPIPEIDADSAGFYLAEKPTPDEAMAAVDKCRARIDEIMRFKAPGTLLDIGCGLGYMVKAAETMGWRAAGCDLSPACCEFGREVLGVQLFSGGFEELPERSGIQAADVITANHVLEHLASPADFVRFAERALAPDGMVVVEIPNLFSFESLNCGESWFGLALPHHVAFYTPESLARLFEPNLTVVQIEYSVSQYFHDQISTYMRRVAVDPKIIDRSARQFSGTAMVAYISKQGREHSRNGATPRRRPLLYRAARKLVRTVSRRE